VQSKCLQSCAAHKHCKRRKANNEENIHSSLLGHVKFRLSRLRKFFSVINKELHCIKISPNAIICTVFCINCAYYIVLLARFENSKYPYLVVGFAPCLKHENVLNELSIRLSATPLKNNNFWNLVTRNETDKYRQYETFITKCIHYLNRGKRLAIGQNTT